MTWKSRRKQCFVSTTLSYQNLHVNMSSESRARRKGLDTVSFPHLRTYFNCTFPISSRCLTKLVVLLPSASCRQDPYIHLFVAYSLLRLLPCGAYTLEAFSPCLPTPCTSGNNYSATTNNTERRVSCVSA